MCSAWWGALLLGRVILVFLVWSIRHPTFCDPESNLSLLAMVLWASGPVGGTSEGSRIPLLPFLQPFGHVRLLFRFGLVNYVWDTLGKDVLSAQVIALGVEWWACMIVKG